MSEFQPVLVAVFWGLVAASSQGIGALISFVARPSRLALGLLMGFGAGAMISSVVYELIIGAYQSKGSAATALGLALGTITFYGLDQLLERGVKTEVQHGGSAGFTILLGVVLDGTVESLVLGMTLAWTGVIELAFLVAIFMSNLPESMAATAEMQKNGWTRRRIGLVWIVIIVISGVMSGLGFGIIKHFPQVTGGIPQAFAAGALLMMLANAMIPEGFELGGKRAGLLFVVGFAFATALTALG